MVFKKVVMLMQYMRLLPKEYRRVIAGVSILLMLVDVVMTLTFVHTLSALFAAIAVFFTLLNALNVLHVPGSFCAMAAWVVSLVSAISVFVPWALCRWTPRQDTMCSCVEDGTIFRILMISMAVILALLIQVALDA